MTVKVSKTNLVMPDLSSPNYKRIMTKFSCIAFLNEDIQIRMGDKPSVARFQIKNGKANLWAMVDSECEFDSSDAKIIRIVLDGDTFDLTEFAWMGMDVGENGIGYHLLMKFR